MTVAIVFKTYAWDAFVHRQAERLAKAAEGLGDLFVSVDETNAPGLSIPFPRVLRTSNPALIASGLPDRFEMGSLLWWNPDYVHYDVRAKHPQYDHYIFIEYDAQVTRAALSRMIDAASSRSLDMIAFPLSADGAHWWWTLPHRQTYRREEIAGVLICISLFSGHALDVLNRRRRAMAQDNHVRYWPSAEAFTATEARKSGLACASIAEWGDVSRYRPFPPFLEDDVMPNDAAAFLHPVLDDARLIGSLLKSTVDVRDYWRPDSDMRRMLARFPAERWRPLLLEASRARARIKARERWQRLRLRLTPGALLS